MSQFGRLELKVIILIENIKAYPELYDPEHFYDISRMEKFQVWHEITKRSGYDKVEEAKCRWRGLKTYFRQHIENVEKKTQRRYVPRTDNPSDKYLKLSDWHYYKHMKFLEPHIRRLIKIGQQNKSNGDESSSSRNAYSEYPVRSVPPEKPQTSILLRTTNSATLPPTKTYSRLITPTTTSIAAPIIAPPPPTATTKTTSPNSTPMKLKVGNFIVEVKVDKAKMLSPNNSNNSNANNAAREMNKSNIAAKRPSPSTFMELSTKDQNLKVYFDAMLRSTQRLPRYHQENVKRKLIAAINRAKVLKSYEKIKKI